MDDPVEPFQEPGASNMKTSQEAGHWWPIVLIALGLVIVMLYLPMIILIPAIITANFAVLNILSTSVFYLAPLLYILGVAFMHREKMVGKRERVRFSTIGGITLILGAIFGFASFLISFNSVWSSGFLLAWNEGFILSNLILPFAGIAGSLLGAYYVLRRSSHIEGLIAGGFSVLLVVPIFPLALVPIALGMMDLQRR